MTIIKIITSALQNVLVPGGVFIASLCFAPTMNATEQISFFALLAQVLATLLVAVALLPRLSDGPTIHWSTLVWLGLGEGLAVYGAIPGWSGMLWPASFAVVLASTATTVFALAATIAPANSKRHREEHLAALTEKAENLDPTPHPGP